MMKKILPTMIGAALAGGMSIAAADVTLFGHIDTSYDYTDQDGGYDASNLNCTTCSFGFKGSEDLGNGLKAIFLIDFQYDTTERNKVSGGQDANIVDSTLGSITYVKATNVSKGSGSLTDRDQWLGLSGGFGQLRVGTISTVYKSHGAMLDPIYRTAQQQRDRGLQSDLHSGAGENGQGRATNTVRYDTPTWNGLGIGAHYTLQTDTGNSTDSPWGIGGQWNSGPFLAFADYITSDAGGDDSAWKLGGKFDYSMFSLLAQYEGDGGLISARGGNQTGGSGDGANTWMLGATATLGNAMAYFGWGRGEEGSGGSIASYYNVWQLVGTYNMSRRTMLYGGYSEIRCDKHDNNVCSAIGENQGDSNDSKVSLGMKHTF
jgi:predicted porin